MSNLKGQCKKSLVRNPQDRVPKSMVTKVSFKNSVQSKPFKEPSRLTSVDLNMPSINSSKSILNNMKQIESSKVKLDDKSLQSTIQEKITKQMNFPYDQNIYKNLIPLCSKPNPTGSLSNRELVPQKDIEPQLEDFMQTKVLPEFTYSVQLQNKDHKMFREYKGDRMYKLIEKW